MTLCRTLAAIVHECACLQALVAVGTAIVGLSGNVCKSDDSYARNAPVGNILVILAQLIAAIQMVIEEKFIGNHKVVHLEFEARLHRQYRRGPKFWTYG